MSKCELLKEATVLFATAEIARRLVKLPSVEQNQPVELHSYIQDCLPLCRPVGITRDDAVALPPDAHVGYHLFPARESSRAVSEESRTSLTLFWRVQVQNPHPTPPVEVNPSVLTRNRLVFTIFKDKKASYKVISVTPTNVFKNLIHTPRRLHWIRLSATIAVHRAGSWQVLRRWLTKRKFSKSQGLLAEIVDNDNGCSVTSSRIHQIKGKLGTVQ
jgi:hypothetical protein